MAIMDNYICSLIFPHDSMHCYVVLPHTYLSYTPYLFYIHNIGTQPTVIATGCRLIYFNAQLQVIAVSHIYIRSLHIASYYIVIYYNIIGSHKK